VAALDRGYAEAGYAGAMRRAADTLAARSQAVRFAPNILVATLYLRAGDRERPWNGCNDPTRPTIPTFSI